MFEDHHALLTATLDDLVEREIRPIAARIDEDDVFPEDGMAVLAGAGHLGSTLPEPYGPGGDLLSYALTVERIAQASPSLAWALVVHVSATMAVANAGTEEQKARLLPSLGSGDRLASFAFTEAGAGPSKAKHCSSPATCWKCQPM